VRGKVSGDTMKSPVKPQNPKIILTAPVTEMSNHHGKIFCGFGACISTPPFPSWFVKGLFYPPVSQHNGQADFAPYALRKIETCLLDSGFCEKEIATVHPEKLDRVVGSETKL